MHNHLNMTAFEFIVIATNLLHVGIMEVDNGTRTRLVSSLYSSCH